MSNKGKTYKVKPIPKQKPCAKCGVVKKADAFGLRKDTINPCLRSYCKPCQSKSNPGYDGTRTVLREEQKNIKKFCHECWQWKPLREYKRIYECDGVVHANNCKECAKDIEKPNNVYDHHHHATPVIVDTANTDHHLMFIGNTPFKELCKMFKLKYNEKKHINERSYFTFIGNRSIKDILRDTVT